MFYKHSLVLIIMIVLHYKGFVKAVNHFLHLIDRSSDPCTERQTQQGLSQVRGPGPVLEESLIRVIVGLYGRFRKYMRHFIPQAKFLEIHCS